MSDTIDCPKCRHRHEPSCETQDGDILHCSKCDFPFHVSVDYSIEYGTECVGHDWSAWTLTPRGDLWQRFCGLCDKCEVSRKEPPGVMEETSCAKQSTRTERGDGR